MHMEQGLRLIAGVINSGKRSSGPLPFTKLALAYYPDGRKPHPILLHRRVTHDDCPAGNRRQGDRRKDLNRSVSNSIGGH